MFSAHLQDYVSRSFLEFHFSRHHYGSLIGLSKPDLELIFQIYHCVEFQSFQMLELKIIVRLLLISYWTTDLGDFHKIILFQINFR